MELLRLYYTADSFFEEYVLYFTLTVIHRCGFFSIASLTVLINIGLLISPNMISNGLSLSEYVTQK